MKAEAWLLALADLYALAEAEWKVLGDLRVQRIESRDMLPDPLLSFCCYLTYQTDTAALPDGECRLNSIYIWPKFILRRIQLKFSCDFLLSSVEAEKKIASQVNLFFFWHQTDKFFPHEIWAVVSAVFSAELSICLDDGGEKKELLSPTLSNMCRHVGSDSCVTSVPSSNSALLGFWWALDD